MALGVNIGVTVGEGVDVGVISASELIGTTRGHILLTNSDLVQEMRTDISEAIQVERTRILKLSLWGK